MKRIIIYLVCIALILPLGIMVSADNGAPSGDHFNLNIIGVKYPKDNMDDISGGNVIFVLLDENEPPTIEPATIWLMKSDTFGVVDKNGTDGEATFQLPVPGTEVYLEDEYGNEIPTGEYITDYSVYARPLGKPSDTLSQNMATFTTFADLIDSGFTDTLAKRLVKKYIDVDNYYDYTITIDNYEQIPEPLEFTRKKGQSKFQNITSEALTVLFLADISIYDAEGNLVEQTTITLRIPLFDAMLENEYWEYDNNGLKLLQIRFYYDVGTDISKKGPNK